MIVNATHSYVKLIYTVLKSTAHNEVYMKVETSGLVLKNMGKCHNKSSMSKTTTIRIGTLLTSSHFTESTLQVLKFKEMANPAHFTGI